MKCLALRRGPRPAGLGVLLAAMSVMGCGPAQVKVTGRVLYDKQPLPGGLVTFRPADPRQNTVSAPIDPQGNYEAVLPAGDVEACVDNRELEPQTSAPVPNDMPPELKAVIEKSGGQVASSSASAPPKEPPESSGKYVKIPDRYYEVETSGIKFTVSSATRQHDIELTR